MPIKIGSEVVRYEIEGYLIVPGDLEINLDSDLEVKGCVYVAGSIKSNVPLSSDLHIIVVGSIFVEGTLRAWNITAGKSIEVSEDIYASGSIDAGYYGDFTPRVSGPVPKGFGTKYNSLYDTYKKSFYIKSGSVITCKSLGCGGKIYAGLNSEYDEIRCEKLMNGKIIKGNLVIDKSKEIREKKDEEATYFAIVFILIILLIGWLSGAFS